MYMTRRTSHLLNKGEGQVLMSVVHVLDKCQLEDEF